MQVARAALLVALAACGGSASPKPEPSPEPKPSPHPIPSPDPKPSPAPTPSQAPSAADLAAVSAALATVDTCRFNEANYGYALDVACPALATVRAARVAAPSVRAIDLAAARGADASPKVRLYVAQQLAAEADADPATATRLVDLLVHERDDKTRNQITRHLFARQQASIVRSAAEVWLVDPDDDVRMIGLGTITDDHFSADATAEAALGALLRAEQDNSVRTAACAAGGAFAGATLAPIVDKLLVDPGLDVAVAAGCVEGLVALWGNGARADAVRAAAFARTMTQLTTRPRGPVFPTSIAIDRITDALRPSVANPAPAAAATWFDAPGLRAALTALLRDTTADWIARSHAATALVLLGATKTDLRALRRTLDVASDPHRDEVLQGLDTAIATAP